MKVEKFVSGFLDTNTYVIEENKHLLIIDPADHAAVLKKCRDAASVTVLLTHEHFDHISGLNRIRDLCASSCRVIAGGICSERIQDTKANLSAYADVLAQLGGKQIPEHWEPFGCQAADITFDNRYAFRWMGHAVELFSAPGHSAGSCCILLDDMLFVGDTVLENNLMVKFPGSSKKLYREVTVPLLEKLLVGVLPEQLSKEQLQAGALLQGEFLQGKLLPGNRITRVYPGHGDAMTPEVALQFIKGV